jgi:hypothetical protein
MQLLTFIAAAAASCAILRAKPLKGLLIFLGFLIWFPQYLTISVGTIDFTLGRILAIVFMGVLLFRTNLVQQFRWRLIDTVMILFVAARFVALTANVPLPNIIEHEGGFFLDVIVPYFMARIVILTREDLIRVIRALVVMAIPLAFIGVFQTITGVNLMGFIKPHYTFVFSGEMAYPQRYGLYRASAHFGIHIIFGLFFAILLPLVANHLGRNGWSLQKTIAAGWVMLMGAGSAVSSTPLFCVIMSGGFFLLYPFRMYWRYLAIVLLAGIVFSEFYSNRHWYEIPSRLALSGSTSYYRIVLIQEALGGGMDGHWLTGYGLVGLNLTGKLAPGSSNGTGSIRT